MKYILMALIATVIVSCKKSDRYNIQPIDKFKGKNYIVAEKYTYPSGNADVLLKSKDSFFSVKIHEIDAQILKKGDTIK